MFKGSCVGKFLLSKLANEWLTRGAVVLTVWVFTEDHEQKGQKQYLLLVTAILKERWVLSLGSWFQEQQPKKSLQVCMKYDCPVASFKTVVITVRWWDCKIQFAACLALKQWRGSCAFSALGNLTPCLCFWWGWLQFHLMCIRGFFFSELFKTICNSPSDTAELLSKWVKNNWLLCSFYTLRLKDCCIFQTEHLHQRRKGNYSAEKIHVVLGWFVYS